jgi:pimeloyl-ACP methyl ester carboxylesterase
MFTLSFLALFGAALEAPVVDEASPLTMSLADGWAFEVDGKAQGTERLPIRKELRRKGRARLTKSFSVSKELLAAKPRLELGAFAGKQVVTLNRERVMVSGGKARGYPLDIDAPPLREGENQVTIDIEFSDWHGGPKSRGTPRLGPATKRTHGLFFLKHRSQADNTEQPYALYLPPTQKDGDKAPLLIVLHGYSGDETSYLYTAVFDYADRDKTVLAVTHGRGRSRYARKGEDDIRECLDDVKTRTAIDPARVSITGASMGGAGALSAGFHYPHLFAASINFMGDSLYTVWKQYIRWHFKTMVEAERYSPLLYAENGIHQPHLWIHGTVDRVAPIKQARWMEEKARELSKKLKIKFPIAFDYAEGYDHEERLLHDRWEKVFAFIRDKRVAEPDRVFIVANSNGLRRDRDGKIRPGQWNRAYWFEMQVAAPGHWGRIEAIRNAKTGKLRVVRRENVKAFRRVRD